MKYFFVIVLMIITCPLFCQGTKLSQEHPTATQKDFEEFKKGVINDFHELAHETKQCIGTIYQTTTFYATLSPCLVYCRRYYNARVPVFPESEKLELKEEQH